MDEGIELGIIFLVVAVAIIGGGYYYVTKNHLMSSSYFERTYLENDIINVNYSLAINSTSNS